MRALAILGLAACYQPRPCEIACTDSCPEGMTCMGNLCTDGQLCEAPASFASVTVGARHACALTSDGAVYCWGDNSQGQLGSDAMPIATLPTRVGDPGVQWTAISAGFAHTCGIHDGHAYCWGANDSGQVTGGQPTTTEPITEVANMPIVDQIAAGKTHSCAIGGGELACWGDPNGGLGSPPGPVDGTWRAVAVASEHTCAITSDSTVKCWGHNNFGELGIASQQNEEVPTTEVQQAPVQTPTTLTTVIRVAVGDNISCAIVGATTDATQGELWCWGADDVRQIDPMIGDNAVVAVRLGTGSDWTAIEIGVDTPAMRSPVMLPGHQRLCGIRGGMVSCWGAGPPGARGDGLWDALATDPDHPVLVAAGDAIALGHAGPGDDFACLTSGGKISCWGDNRYAELGIGHGAMETTPVMLDGTWAKPRSGQHHTCAISAGVLRCWGADEFGQVIPGHALGHTSPCTADDCDATKPVDEPPPIDQPDDIVAGDDFTCTRTHGDVHCWGNDANGELGVGAMSSPITTVVGTWSSLTGGDRMVCGTCAGSCYECWGQIAGVITRTPTTPLGTPPYDELHAGDDFVCGRKGNTRYCWGDNASGQVGNGTAVGPVTMAENFENFVTQVAAAGLHACAVHSDGGIVDCWGFDAFGESGVVPPIAAVVDISDVGLTGCTAVAVAPHYACAICGGVPACWGSNATGELGRGTTSPFETPAAVNVPTGLTFTEIIAGETRACALTDMGALYCWGYGPRGELGTGGHATNLPTPLGPLQ